MMQCSVLLFAQLAETVGANRLTLDLPDGSTVSDALDTLSDRHPGIADLRTILAVAVNERYASQTAALTDGDTIALIPPVSGG
jgi:molybdopterin converting factor subunit 1